LHAQLNKGNHILLINLSLTFQSRLERQKALLFYVLCLLFLQTQEVVAADADADDDQPRRLAIFQNLTKVN
jgi:hypothetical protein